MASRDTIKSLKAEIEELRKEIAELRAHVSRLPQHDWMKPIGPGPGAFPIFPPEPRTFPRREKDELPLPPRFNRLKSF